MHFYETLIFSYIKYNAPSKGNTFFLFFFPRTRAQAQAFRDGVDKIIFLDVTDKEALWRISGRMDVRDDETLPAIRKRIAYFHEWTMPILDFYQKQNKLIKINGEQDVAKILGLNIGASWASATSKGRSRSVFESLGKTLSRSVSKSREDGKKAHGRAENDHDHRDRRKVRL